MVSGVPALASVSALAVSALALARLARLRSRRFLDLRCGVGGLGGGFARAGRRFGHGGPFRPRPACEPSPSDALPHRAGSLRTARSGRRTRGYVFLLHSLLGFSCCSRRRMQDGHRQAVQNARSLEAGLLGCDCRSVEKSLELTTVQRLGQCDAGIAPTLRWNPGCLLSLSRPAASRGTTTTSHCPSSSRAKASRRSACSPLTESGR